MNTSIKLFNTRLTTITQSILLDHEYKNGKIKWKNLTNDYNDKIYNQL